MIEIYSFGYKNQRFSPFAEKLQEHKINAVIDTRFNPNCYDAFWQKKGLESTLPLYRVEYLHFKDLGNKNYYDHNLPIEIKDLKLGLQELNQTLKFRGISKICLLCTCSNIKTCHNNMIIKELELSSKYSNKGRL